MSEELTVTVLRYSNRKFYAGKRRNQIEGKARWLSLAELAKFVRTGRPLRVLCARTKNDLTVETLKKVIAFNEERSKLPCTVGELERVIRTGNGTFSQFKPN